MKLINTDGMVFIGPGSEWLWTAVSGVVLAGTFVAIWYQLRLQRSAGAIEELDAFLREWTSERMARYQLEVLVALRDGTEPAHIPPGAGFALGNYWEKIAILAHGGHLDRKLLWNTSAICELWWAILRPSVRRVRDELGLEILSDFEWLAGAMAEMDRRAGKAVIYDKARIASALEPNIATLQDAIRVEQALRTVILASPDAVAVGQPSAAKAEKASAPAAAPGCRSRLRTGWLRIIPGIGGAPGPGYVSECKATPVGSEPPAA